MKLLGVGCGHLGDGSKSDDWGTINIDFKFHEWMEEEFPDVIVFLGDMLELFQFSKKKIKRAHLTFFNQYYNKKKIWLNHPLSGEGKWCKIIWINGNHDFEFWRRDYWRIKTDDGKIIEFGHGHENDGKFMSGMFAKRINWIIGRTIEKIWPNVDNYEIWLGSKRADRKTREYGHSRLNVGMWCWVGAHVHPKDPFVETSMHGSWKTNLDVGPIEKIYANAGRLQHYGKEEDGRIKTFEGVIIDTATNKIEMIRS